MKTNLTDYIQVYNGSISEDLCNRTVSSLQNVKWELHTFYDAMNNTKSSHDNEPHSYYKKVDTTYELMDCLKKVISGYVSSYEFTHWNSWLGFSYPKFNRYVVGSEMTNHCDHIHSLFSGDVRGIPVLTMIGQLNKEYSGGELVLLDKQYDLGVGDVLIFPSCFLYPHHVKKVTDGVRYSLASWSW